MRMNHNQDEALKRALDDGWSKACLLYRHLRAGGTLIALPQSAIRFNPDEVAYADSFLGYARFYGTAVAYKPNSLLLFGSVPFVVGGLAANAIANSIGRQRANAMAATQWRDHADVRTVLTNQRLICDYQGQWLSFWHNGIMELQGDVAQWVFTLRYGQGDPLMLHGPAAPWFAIGVAHLAYGRRGLGLPAFAAVAQAVANQERIIPGEVVVDPDPPLALPPA
jgi:hypothetical protein